MLRGQEDAGPAAPATPRCLRATKLDAPLNPRNSSHIASSYKEIEPCCTEASGSDSVGLPVRCSRVALASPLDQAELECSECSAGVPDGARLAPRGGCHGDARPRVGCCTAPAPHENCPHVISLSISPEFRQKYVWLPTEAHSNDVVLSESLEICCRSLAGGKRGRGSDRLQRASAPRGEGHWVWACAAAVPRAGPPRADPALGQRQLRGHSGATSQPATPT